MVRKRDAVETSLEKKGFERKTGDHVFFIYYTTDGRKTSVRTKMSYGSSHRDISQNLVSRMAKQCRLATSDFKRLVDCPLSRKDYEEMLKKKSDI